MNIVKAYSDVFRQAAPLVEPRVLFLPKGTSNKQMGIKFSICSFSFGYTIYIPRCTKSSTPGVNSFYPKISSSNLSLMLDSRITNLLILHG